METNTHHLVTDERTGLQSCIYCKKAASELRRQHSTDSPTHFTCPEFPV